MSDSSYLLRLAKTIKGPIVTEKSAIAGEKSNTLSLWVDISATKLDVARAVEQFFKVPVVSVRTSVLQGKSKRFGKFEGKQVKRKKAFVRLAADAEVNLTEISV